MATRGGAKKSASKKRAASKKAAAKKTTAKKAAAKKKAAATTATAAEQGYPVVVPKGSPFSKAFLTAQRDALVEERESYTRSAARLKAEADELAAEREPGDVQFDEESGEGDTIAVERERDLALSAQALETISEIDAALERLAEGTYGICEVSGEPIPEERLEAIPYARVKVEYKASRLGS
ncbi:MAG: TraR/DksA C4-type zinc finger protein [Actinomycetota bacterium]